MSTSKARAGQKAQPPNVIDTGEPRRRILDRSDPLNDASLRLLEARSILDLLHESVCSGGSLLIEQVDTGSWAGIFYTLGRIVEEAKELIDGPTEVKS